MDIRAVDLNLLKAFDALIRERAVTRAAARIGLSQPAMSHALSRLRSLFDDDLFVRTPLRMEPTARTREIAPLGSAAIEHIEAALNLGVGFDPATSAGILTAGMAEYAEVALVGRLAESCARQAPQATLRLTPVTGIEAVEQLESGAIDVAAAHLRTLPTHLDSIVLLRDPFVLIARRGHPLAGKSLSIEAYAGLDHILVSPRGATTGAVDRVVAEYGLKRHRTSGCDLSGLAGGARRIRPRGHGAAAHRPANRCDWRNRHRTAADRPGGAGIDGLAPPRGERAGSGLVPLVADRSGGELTTRGPGYVTA
jgi:DNA-binding transcriptional LysR family regulator